MASPIRYEQDTANIVTLTFDAPGAPVNTMTEAWQSAFADAVARLQKDKDSIAGVILASAQKTFFAGRGIGACQVTEDARWLCAAVASAPISAIRFHASGPC